MGYETLTGGLELVLPTNGTTNWGTIVRNSTWVKINNHNHTGGGQGELLTGASLVNNSIDGTKLSQNLALTEASLVSATAPGNTALINWNSGNKASLDVSAADAAVTVTLSNPIQGASYRLAITQGGTPQICIWPAAVKWPGGEEPTQFMEASTKAMILLDYDGTDYLGTWELEYA